ncbi:MULTISPECIES: hypothetical protein [unclassified Methylibium]|uniref:hypothetical protein n=1 Tax=unclassified Methylibium TaxID=2633235 RepID=UPI0003F443C0|nr:MULTISPECIES: hypothetical protein [unclassified Methylibium]EWS54453.1 hypothetical protein X551_02745 [Methylibium sp. T29]EWS58548.1 hypothetical protein Y694_03585 [Methylibium sp. T29-B]
MSDRAALIERERRKLVWLRAKVSEQEARVRALEDLADDPLDEMFDKETRGQSNAADSVQAPAHAPQPVIASTSVVHQETRPQRELIVSDAARVQLQQLLKPVASAAWSRRPRQIAPNWVRILGFIGREGKTYTEVREFIAKENLAISPEAARTALMNYRKDFGLVENPKRGFYIATERALAIIEAQKNESPAFAENGAHEPQPT